MIQHLVPLFWASHKGLQSISVIGYEEGVDFEELCRRAISTQPLLQQLIDDKRERVW